jgi:FeS assembly SUF system protein
MFDWGQEPNADTLSDFSASAGTPLEEGVAPAQKNVVIDALQTVYDPEIPVNIYDLGLIYECDISGDGSVCINMSLTAPGCPVAGEMPGMVADAVSLVEGVGEVEVSLVWEPPWHKDLMSEDAKLALNID